MTEQVRAFIAIELPHPIKDALAGLVEELRGARVSALRPVAPSGIHLTLKFLGNLPGPKVPLIVEAVSQAVRERRPFTLRLGDVGVFPSRSRTRVLWVGVEDDEGTLLALHERVETALDGMGFARERRKFSPHLTLARVRDRATASERSRAAEALFAARDTGAGLPIEVASVRLMRSILSPQGAVHECLATIPLVGGNG
jgi:2'-5' RNA ligase